MLGEALRQKILTENVGDRHLRERVEKIARDVFVAEILRQIDLFEFDQPLKLSVDKQTSNRYKVWGMGHIGKTSYEIGSIVDVVTQTMWGTPMLVRKG